MNLSSSEHVFLALIALYALLFVWTVYKILVSKHTHLTKVGLSILCLLTPIGLFIALAFLLFVKQQRLVSA